MPDDLAYRRIDQARVQVFDWPVVRVPDGFRGGPVLPEPEDAALRHTRGRRPVDSFRPGESFDDLLAGDYVYAGPIYGHFGHFMAEFVHRIVPARLRGLKFPLLFVSTQDHNPHGSYGDFPDVVKEVLAFLDVRPHHLRVINRNTIVERLHVMEAGSDLGGGPKPGYVEALATYCRPRLNARHGDTARPRKLYVSRSALKPQGMLLGEAWFEGQLEREGFTVFRPEEWRVTPQMDHYRKAEAVVFLEGSACHGTELLGAAMMERSFILPRRGNREVHNLRRVVEPRSCSFAVLDGCADFLGSAAADKQSGQALSHLGVSCLDLERTAAVFRQHGLAQLPGLSEDDYATAAEADLRRYMTWLGRAGGPLHAGHAEEVCAAFARRGGRRPDLPADHAACSRLDLVLK